MQFTDLNSLVVFFGSLAGIGALIACLVNIGKTIGFIKDGEAPQYVILLNLLGMLVLFVIGLVKPAFNFQGLDAQAAQVATILMILFGLFWQIYSSKIVHDHILKGAPLIGTSFTLQAKEIQQPKST